MLFSQINPSSPSPTETKSLFFASVSLSPCCILGHCYHLYKFYIYAFSSVQFLSRVQLCNLMNRSTPGLPVHHQLPEFTQTHVIESVMPSNHLILFRPLLLLPSIFSSIRSFPVSRRFASGGQSIGVSASALVLPRNIPWVGLHLLILAPLPHKRAGIPLEDASQEVVLLSTRGHLPKLWGPQAPPMREMTLASDTR